MKTPGNVVHHQAEARRSVSRTLPDWIWFVAAFGAHTGWGINPALVRYLQTVSHLPSMALLSLGHIIALIVLLPIVIKHLNRRILRSRVLWIFALFVVLRAITNILAARFTLAIYVQLITLMTPFVVALLSATFLREKLPPLTLPAISFSLFGAVLMMSSDIGALGIELSITPTDWIGIGLALFSTFCLALYMISVRRTAEVNLPGEAVFVFQLIAILGVSLPLSLLLGEDWGRWLEIGVFDWFIFAAFFFGVLLGANMSQIIALRHLGAPRVSSLMAWRLVSTLILGGLLLGERLTSIWQVAGAVIVVLTLSWYLWQQRAIALAHRRAAS